MERLLLARAATAVLVGVCCLCGAARGQVDWGDLFPEEKSPQPVTKPVQPAPVRPAAPRVSEPQVAAPAARPPVRKAPAAPSVAAPPAAPRVPELPARPAVQAGPTARPTVAAVRVKAQPTVAPTVPQPIAAKPPAPPAALQVSGRQQVSLADLGLREGHVIDGSNVDEYADYMSPGLQWAVRYGWRLTVTEAKHIPMLRAYREATEKYSGQVQLGPDGLTLRNYVAGQPFPTIDPADPQAAQKIMWNFYYGWAYTDDVDIRLFDADTGGVGPGRGMSVDRHYIIQDLRRLYYNGRLFVDPKPVFPNDEGYRFKESLHPILEPFDLKGVGFVAYRYLDPARQDDTWLYLPQLRRVRRMSSAQRSDALFGQDTDVDSYWGYNGHVAWNEYRLLGEQTILATMHARNFPVRWQEPTDFLYDDIWEPRRVWVVEARSKLPQYAYSKRIIFIDKEAYVIPYSDIYDRGGQLWKIWVHLYGFRKKAMPNARLAVYEDDMAFSNAILMLDVQLAHATRGALPSTKGTGEEGWYINLGEKSGTSEEFFTVAHMIEAGH